MAEYQNTGSDVGTNETTYRVYFELSVYHAEDVDATITHMEFIGKDPDALTNVARSHFAHFAEQGHVRALVSDGIQVEVQPITYDDLLDDDEELEDGDDPDEDPDDNPEADDVKPYSATYHGKTVAEAAAQLTDREIREA